MAGLKILDPNPPYTCLAKIMALNIPIKIIHHGDDEGIEIIKSQQVTMVEPSNKKGFAEIFLNLRLIYSNKIPSEIPKIKLPRIP